MKKALEERFWEKVVRTDTCWLWNACRQDRGYGFFGVNGKNVIAHRFAYELVRGSIPDGLTVDHLCRNPRCVNPAHMELVTVKENVLRGTGPTALNKLKLRCPKGHLYDTNNTYWTAKGRHCKTCRLETTRAWRNKQKRTGGS